VEGISDLESLSTMRAVFFPYVFFFEEIVLPLRRRRERKMKEQRDLCDGLNIVEPKAWTTSMGSKLI
jgi:hypothetical protein